MVRPLGYIFDRLVVDEDGCWRWPGAKNPKGYGVIRRDGKRLPVHRVAYELRVGPIPDGLVLDHLCRVRNCANPAHLEPVTPGENTLRGEGPAAVNARKTHCSRGHLLCEGNLLDSPSGRRCLACKRLTSARHRVAAGITRSAYGRATCPECGGDVALTIKGRIRSHGGANGAPGCSGSGGRPASEVA
jgi:hypothetical protein